MAADIEAQVPRLTSVLRILATPGSNVDVDLQAVERSAALLEKRQQAATRNTASGGAGSSPLAQLLLGVWRDAPKPAKEAYEKLLQGVSRLFGGEMPSGEWAELAMAVWRVLGPLPPPEVARGRGSSLVIKPYREALVSKIGPLEDDTLVQEVVLLVGSCRDWQAKLNPKAAAEHAAASSGSTTAKPTAGAGTASAAQGTSGQAVPHTPAVAVEFGADLGFVGAGDLYGGLSSEALMAKWLGLAPTDAPASIPAASVVQQQQQQQQDEDSIDCSPEALRRIMAQGGVSAADLAEQQARATANAAPYSMYDDGEDAVDYEDKKKSRETGVAWLHQWCTRVVGADEALSIATSICLVLLKEQGSGDATANDLVEMLGFAAFEAIGELMDNRRAILSAIQATLPKLREEMGPDEPGAQSGGSSCGPSFGPGVVINSESSKMLAKIARKEQRRARGPGTQTESDLELILALGFKALLDIEHGVGSDIITLGNGVELRIGSGETGTSMTRGALPVGTKRKNFKGYEEVHVPPAAQQPPPGPDELVKIEHLPDWAQLAFQGYKTLNRIQSRIFRTAFESNENVLVCAPTGAGKTNIAMIAVLREVGLNMRYGVIQKGEFKIVYVAPMKALAAEVTSNFSKRLEPLGLVVRELTGDMQLSKKELSETQMIVTTPEKWDVITRKGGDVSIAALVKLLIIDEVHLLNDDRGPVIETLIARTLRQVEATQAMIRIVGLSATLPNYQDVAHFLKVNIDTGLFHFDASFRPVPLELQFVGVSETNHLVRTNLMNEICYNKVIHSLKQGNQVMVFLHSRKDTGKTARILADLAQKANEQGQFDVSDNPKYGLALKDVKKSRNKEVAELFNSGFGIHHAGMLRADRTLTERLFADGLLKVLCCTATLAWGVNLPAHTVVIKGTQVYDAQKGAFNELGMLDVQQIFGRAGRPQFDSSGEGIIITSHDKLAHYLGMLTHQLPIESQFRTMMADNLNAEVVLGTVTNLREAVAWLGYTYLAQRMTRNPLAYGRTWADLATDPALAQFKRQLIIAAANELKKCQMAVFDEKSGNLYVTELGRVASHFYIRHQSMVVFNECLKPHMTEAELLAMIAQSSEFDSMMVREEEMPEVEKLLRNSCPYDVKGGMENKVGKVNILMQAWISRAKVESFSLIADMMYVSSNGPRIVRAVFEICIRRKWSSMADTALSLAKSFELRLWPHQHPLRQLEPGLSPELLEKLEDRGLWLEQLEFMEAGEIGAILRHPAAGPQVRRAVDAFPSLDLEAQIQPITRTVLRIQLSLRPTFQWEDRAHGGALRWHVWVEDSASEHIYHNEVWVLTKKMSRESEDHKLAFTIPIFEPLPPQYYIRAVSDSWLGSEAMLPISFHGLILPERMPPHTELMDLDPLPLSALSHPVCEEMYAPRFTHFNPIQTQAFHTLYHTDENVLLGAPTGSGKTISSELAILRLFAAHPGSKVIYIAPLKALVRERIEDWTKGLCARLGKKMVELTGDYTPDLRALLAADIIIATPEKWDGISRNWQSRAYVKKVGLLIIDEIHLLGADRGPILEVIVSRMRYIAAQTERAVRFVGLSTALANAQDLADWLGVGPLGLFNFKPSVRPVPLEAHIQGYPGKFYCPRMATMNKPAYAAIQMHSPIKPVLVFVSSRRQTRLTALDLITYAVADDRPNQWVHMGDEELASVLAGVKDTSLRHTLQFGIGLHHAGLNDKDRSLCEKLFVSHKIQLLIATSTLAWGVNTPAHLVIIKGTEFFDAPTRRYVDFPITDVLQMMGRAGRPQYDHHGVAVIMVHEPKKQFYKRFLYEPFPVESSLHEQIADHFNAEIVGGTIASRQDAVDYLTWTYFFRRLVQNPSYYDLADTSAENINAYVSDLVESALESLEEAGCVTLSGRDGDGGLDGEGDVVAGTTLGRIASFYYLDHHTMSQFVASMAADLEFTELLQVLCSVPEYDELPVRHNEDKLNVALAREVRYAVDTRTADDPHTKANLLLQAHFSHLTLPVSDYITDTKTVLDNSLRILQAMMDVAADRGWLMTALGTANLIQSIMQACWPDDNGLQLLPNMSPAALQWLAASEGVTGLPQLLHALSSPAQRQSVLEGLTRLMGGGGARECLTVADRLPIMALRPHMPKLVPVGGGSAKRHAVHGGGAALDGDDGGCDPLGEEAFELEWVLEVELSRRGITAQRGAGRARVYAPHFPKVKEEGWYLVAGDVDTHELLALRRVSVEERSSSVRLTVPRSNGAGEEMAHVTLFLMSDSYPGLDQQVDIPLSTSVGGLEPGRRGGRQRWGVPGPMLSLAELWGEKRKGQGGAGKGRRARKLGMEREAGGWGAAEGRGGRGVGGREPAGGGWRGEGQYGAEEQEQGFVVQEGGGSDGGRGDSPRGGAGGREQQHKQQPSQQQQQQQQQASVHVGRDRGQRQGGGGDGGGGAKAESAHRGGAGGGWDHPVRDRQQMLPPSEGMGRVVALAMQQAQGAPMPPHNRGGFTTLVGPEAMAIARGDAAAAAAGGGGAPAQAKGGVGSGADRWERVEAVREAPKAAAVPEAAMAAAGAAMAAMGASRAVGDVYEDEPGCA
ncbi:MAG: hypothetical protein WDW36_005207 [Sanguina aurantia]